MSKEILSDRQNPHLLIEERRRRDVVIGAPHHTVGGVPQMPCPEHKDGDENTGFIARDVAEKLELCSIIACNYTIDANKSLETDYAKQIAKWKPKYLVEIHGHGAKKIDSSKIEISSGTIARNSISIRFASCLQKQLSKRKETPELLVDGDFKSIHFKAKHSATITHTGWIAIHIELPPIARLSEDKSVAIFHAALVESIAESIKEVCI